MNQSIQPWSLPVDALGLAKLPKHLNGDDIDWASGIRHAWAFGEDGAVASLERFLEHGLYHFENSEERFRADKHHTAAISPYVRFGELSVRTIYHRVKQTRGLKYAKTFIRRLVWRDLAYVTHISQCI